MIAPEGGAELDRSSPDAVTRQLVERSAPTRRLGRAPPPAGPPEEAPSTIGRFLVLRELGRGGMGVVYLAYDDQLDRRIAVKLLRRGRDGSEGSARMYREAQAMARLSHPNVVQVYDVGRHDGDIYVAMEYIRGETLRAYIRRGGHHWRDVLRVLSDAGRGLAAAHEAGLVHRDFKPENVLLGEDGRVCVLDFGLARERSAREAARPPSHDAELTSAERSLLSVELTGADGAIGTPAYMPPEQIDNGALSPRSDIFSFCVTLHEALYGQRPFKGSTPGVLHARILRGERQTPDKLKRVPARIYRVLTRGLDVDPDARWPSMDELLAALARDPTRALLRVGGGLLVVTALVTATALLSARPRGPAICHDPASALADVWDAARSRDVQAAFSSSDASYAPRVWERTRRKLDAYGDGFRAALNNACDAADLRRAAALVPVHCLELGREELRALATALATADEDILREAAVLVDALEDPVRCLDTRRARAPSPPEPERAQAVVRLRGELARARAELNAGDLDEAKTRCEAIERRAAELEHPPVTAELLLLKGALEARASNPDLARALERYEEAYRVALTAGHDEVAISALIQSAITSANARRSDAALARALDAHAMLARLGFTEEDPNALLIRQALALGVVYIRTSGRGEEAHAQLGRALELALRVYPPDSLKLAEPHYLLANASLITGRRDEALEHAQRALELTRQANGADHQRTGDAHNAVGLVLKNLRRFEEAVEHLERAIEIATHGGGALNKAAGISLLNLARALRMMKRYEDAERRFQQLIDYSAAVDGRGSVAVASMRYELVRVLRESGRDAEARALLDRAHDEYVNRRGPDSSRVAAELDTLLGKLTLEEGDATKARMHYAAAVREWGVTDSAKPLSLARARFGHARALWLDGQREQARREAELARAELRELGGEGDATRQRVDEWLAERER